MTCKIGKNIESRNRSFVPADADLGDPDVIEGLYDRLSEMDPKSSSDLEAWLLDWSELEAAIHQEEAIRYIRMTCQTDDEEREKAFLHFVENVSPRMKARQHELAVKFLDSPGLEELDRERYEVLIRDLKSEVELFREENIPLQTEQERLSQRYQKITGAMTVEFDGKEQTLQQMARYLELAERETREAAWKAIVERRLEDRQKLDELFDEMREVRAKIAKNAGFGNFRDYAMKSRKRFDYGVAECEEFHKAVEEAAVPLYREFQEDRKKRMGLDTLRPWDLGPDPEGRPPLKPFEKADELVKGCKQIFNKLDPVLGERFNYLIEHDLLDLESRKGKAPGAYSHSLEEARRPFIFSNSVGLDRDVNTLLHEAGHAFHTLEAADEDLVFYRHAPMEFAEVASMSMEFLGSDHLDVFYSSDQDLLRSREDHLRQVAMLFCWIATVDAFQHWIYTNPGHNADDRADKWIELRQRFGGIEDYSGFEEARRFEWHRQLHIFEVPFYYIEYGIAELGALQIWVRSRNEGRAALDDYRKALSLGGSKPLPQLFEAAGIKFDMKRETLEPLLDEIRSVLSKS